MWGTEDRPDPPLSGGVWAHLKESYSLPTGRSSRGLTGPLYVRSQQLEAAVTGDGGAL